MNDKSPTLGDGLDPVADLARAIRQATNEGRDLVEILRRVARGEPIPQKIVPTLEDRKWASKRLAWLAERGVM